MPVAASGSYKMFKESSGELFWRNSQCLNVSRTDFGAAGNEDGALVFGGAHYVAPIGRTLQCTEEWNGSSWSSRTGLPSSGGGVAGNGIAANAGFGTANAAVSQGGGRYIPSSDVQYSYFAPAYLSGAPYIACRTNIYNGSTWSTDANSSNLRYGRCGVGTQNAGSVLGGFKSSPTGYFDIDDKVEWYDGATWSSRPNLNYSIAGNTVVGSQAEEFTFGGAYRPHYNVACANEYYTNSPFVPGFPSSGFSNQMSVGGVSWSNESGLNVNRVGLSGVGTQNAAIAMGGGETTGTFPATSNYIYKCVEEWDGTTWSTSNISNCNLLPQGRSLFKALGNVDSIPVNSSSSLFTIGGSPTNYFINYQGQDIPGYTLDATANNEPTNSIAHGLEEGGSLGDPTQFNTQITNSTASKYDTFFSGDIRTKSDVSESLQWRNYPGEEQCIASASFEEIFYPGNNTSSLEVTLQVDKVHNSASGSVESGSLESVGFLILTGSKNSSITASANAGPNSTFVGWSNTPVFNVPRIFRLFRPIYNLIETSTTLKIDLEEEDQTYYAIFDFDVIEKKYCYTTSSNRNDICLECQEEKTIYFNKTNYENTGSEGITWYENTDLTVTASDGYYYLSGSDNPIVYNCTTGSAEFELICEGDVIYCS